MTDPSPFSFLLSQGSCCGLGCRNCPYEPSHQTGSSKVNVEWLEFAKDNPEVSRDAFDEK